MIAITPDLKKLIASSQFEGALSIEALAKRAKLTTTQTNYGLHKLKELSIIDPYPLINLLQVYRECGLFFTLTPKARQKDSSFFTFIKNHPRVVWHSVLTGDFHCAVTLLYSEIQEITDFLHAIYKKCGAVFSQKRVSFIQSFTIFRKKYLTTSKISCDPQWLLLEQKGEKVTLSDEERALISALYRSPGSNDTTLAKLLGIPRTTVRYRLEQLKKRKLFLENIFHVSMSRLGYLRYRILIESKHAGPDFIPRLRSWCYKTGYIANMTTSIGASDIELAVEVPDASLVSDISDSVSADFEQEIGDIRILSVLRQGVSAKFFHDKLM